MSDAFDCVTAHVRSAFSGEPVCVHVDNAQECEIKRHHHYDDFRSKAVVERAARRTRSRLWDSMVAMGRLSDMRGDDKWRMAVVDCLTSFLRKRSEIISREFYADLEDIRSEMVAAALDTWVATEVGTPPSEVPGLMLKAAVNAAYACAKVHDNESTIGDSDVLRAQAEAPKEFTINASAVIHNANVRDPAVAEQILGESHGAKLQRFVPSHLIEAFHQDIRTGRRPSVPNRLATESMLTRTFVTGGNHYYYASDLYPTFVGLPIAAEVLGIAPSSAYRMVRAGTFPCPTTFMGRKHQVYMKALMSYLAIPDIIVHPDDVENGAAHAS
ncbi:helix-turn-helix transcriptional regulator [Streptomyces sp. NPDC048182]|uniref:helix-turn-helix transcriptional regulator n=1 Tax=Streptomyces sp. NPDC048182 TaxID=3365507 RepID=UPI00371744A1